MRSLALNNHEFLAGRLAARFLDLEGDQKDIFQQNLKDWSTRVSKSEVDSIAARIEAIGNSGDPAIAKEIQQAIRGMMVAACTDFAPVLAGLRPAQIEHLREKIAERNDKHDPEKNSGLESYRKSKLEEQFESTVQWLGTVSDGQKKTMSDAAREVQDPSGKWERDYLAYSREAQDAFVAILVRHRGDADALGEKCREYARDPDSFLSASSRATKAAVAEFRRKSLAGVFATLNAAQRVHLQREAGKLAADLRLWAQRVRDEVADKTLVTPPAP